MRATRAVGVIGAIAAAAAMTVIVPAGCMGKGGAPPKTAGLGADWRAAVVKKAAEMRGKPRTLPRPKAVTKNGAQTQVTYYIDSGLIQLIYPNPFNLPQEYWQNYPDLPTTVKNFTTQSAVRDGFTDATVTVTVADPNNYQIQISSVNPGIQGIPEMHFAFLLVSLEGLVGSALCMQCTQCSSCSLCQDAAISQCWDPGWALDADKGQPWAPFLPLGLPLVNQKTVLLLDYPPTPGLQVADYLANFTMCRWANVLGATGAATPLIYEPIVDSRPIAAPGTGQESYLPLPMPTYNDQSATTGGYYISPMLTLLTNPMGPQGPNSLPMVALGYPARQTLGQIVNYGGTGAVPPLLKAGTTTLGGQQTAWLSTNHPDVTAYDTCAAPQKGDLIKSEQIDLVATCWMMAMGQNPAQDPNAAVLTCQGQWQPPTAPPNALAACMQEKFDDDTWARQCCTYQDAWAYCTDNNNNACATPDCNVNPVTKAKAPPTPSWWLECNHYRGGCGGGSGAAKKK